jgi:hypothetical protein
VTERNQVWRTIQPKLVPYGFFQRVESQLTGVGIPDVHYCVRGVSGWFENKLGEREGKRPDELTLAQVAWMEDYARHGGIVYLLVLYAADRLWCVYDAVGTRALWRGLSAIPVLRREGEFPTKEFVRVLSCRGY